MSAAVLFAGASPSKIVTVFRHMGLKGISRSTFHKQQRIYLQPSIVRSWKAQQSRILQYLREAGEPLVLAGDGRCDSPGFSAKFGLYTLMDMKTCLIIHVELVQSTEVSSSQAMELEGLKRGLEFLESQGLKVKTLITDRHRSIGAYMRDFRPDVDHRFDVWHIAKGVKNKLLAAGKVNGCGEIGDWRKAIINHLYWSATSTPSGDGEVMVAKFYSLLNHVTNKHTHDDHPEVKECSHGDISPREWMKKDSMAYEKVEKIVTSGHLKGGLKKMSPLEQTSKLEGFHSLLCFWAPKLLAFSYPGMICRSYLACLHWNENGDREQATKADGTLQYNLVFPRYKQQEHSVKKVLKPCTYSYVNVLRNCAVKMAVKREKKASLRIPELQHRPALCADYPRPSKEEAIQNHLSRYENRNRAQ